MHQLSRQSRSGVSPAIRRITAQQGIVLRSFSSSAPRNDLAAFIEPCYDALTVIHDISGLPWAATIPLTAITLRTVFTTPLAIAQRIRAKKQAEVAPLVAAMTPVIRAHMASEATRGNAQLTSEQIVLVAAKEQRKRRIALYKRYGIQSWKMLMLPAVQIPLFIAMSLTVRTMCGWTVLPGLEVSSGLSEAAFFWCGSLARPDPFGVLPLAVGVCALGNLELHANQIPVTKAASIPAALMNISRAGCIFFMAMTFPAPAAIGLYWLTSNAYSFCLNLLLNRYLPLNEKIDYGEVSEVILPEEQRTSFAEIQSEENRSAATEAKMTQ